VGGQFVDFIAGFEYAVPADEEGDSGAAFVGGAFLAFHAGVVGDHGLAVFVGADFASTGAASGHSVVGEKDEDGILEEVPFFHLLQESAHVFINVFDHAVESGSFS